MATASAGSAGMSAGCQKSDAYCHYHRGYFTIATVARSVVDGLYGFYKGNLVILLGVDSYTQPSFSLQSRIARACWGTVWLFLFRMSPLPFFSWRRGLLRLFGARVAKGVKIYPAVRIWAPWLLDIGEESGIGNGANVYNMAQVSIGRRCVISQGAHLCAGTHDIDSANFQLVAKPIVLGDRVWICAEAFVGPGVRIAEGCVIGARAVMFGAAEEGWMVWSGNPAQPRRKRATAAAR